MNTESREWKPLPPRWNAKQLAEARAEVERLRARIAEDQRWLNAKLEAIAWNEMKNEEEQYGKHETNSI